MSTSDNKAVVGESSMCPEPFTIPGKCNDEVRVVFDDQQEFYVSQNLLILTSPVFEAMFKNNFKEKQQSAVHLTGKKYTDFHDFLMCIHPGILKQVTEDNVLPILHIAEEYQVQSIIKSCQSMIKTWLERIYENSRKSYNFNYPVLPTRQCLIILTTCLALNYKSLAEIATDTLAKLPHRMYYGMYVPDNLDTYHLKRTHKLDGRDVTYKEIVDECRQIFQTLPAELRCTILSKRLALYKDNDVK